MALGNKISGVFEPRGFSHVVTIRLTLKHEKAETYQL